MQRIADVSCHSCPPQTSSIWKLLISGELWPLTTNWSFLGWLNYPNFELCASIVFLYGSTMFRFWLLFQQLLICISSPFRYRQHFQHYHIYFFPPIWSPSPSTWITNLWMLSLISSQTCLSHGALSSYDVTTQTNYSRSNFDYRQG